MNAVVTKWLTDRAKPEVLTGAMAFSLALVALAGYLYVLKGTVSEYARLEAARESLAAKVTGGQELSGNLQILEEQIEALTDRLYGQKRQLSLSQIVAHTIDRLDQLSGDHEVELMMVRPGEKKSLNLFEEIPFHMRVSGSYFNLYRWLHDVERALGPMVVKRIGMRGRGEDTPLVMELDMVSYRPKMGAG